MSNLSDFLKVKKVRCVSNLYEHVRKDKPYKLIGIRVFITDESGDLATYPVGDFEPVIETATQATDSSTPMGTRTVDLPVFKKGQKAYVPWMNDGKIVTLEVDCNGDLCANTLKGKQDFDKYGVSFGSPTQPDLFHATQENYELLSKLMPWIDFEKPPVLLQGSDLCRALLDKGWKYVPCYVSDVSEKTSLETEVYSVACGINEDCKFICADKDWKYAVPFDPKTGNPLTEAVLQNA